MQAKPRLEWRPQASADLLEIVAYIADDNPDAAQELSSHVATMLPCFELLLLGQAAG